MAEHTSRAPSPPTEVVPTVGVLTRAADSTRRFFDSDVFHSFRTSPVTVAAFLVTMLCFLAAFLAPYIAPHNTNDVSTLNLMDAFRPPAWLEGGDRTHLLGTDEQGRDVLSAIMFGMRVSLIVGFASVAFSVVLGVGLGLLSGYVGGRVDHIIMRIADVQLSFPAVLVALLLFGFAKTVLPKEVQENVALLVLILAIGLSNWVQFARTVRGSTMVEKNKEYVQAARVIGRRPFSIMVHHVLPNVMGPVLVIATISLALAILTEATLSFLGVGVPPTQPSLGTLIRFGNDFLFSGEWWMTIFPGLALVVLALAVNLLGDWLRDALNPKLR
ncbi:MAG: ABC transporter permease [Ectothiorhodospiraceae bacterium]|nr:ABC transporter permease [Ectothiorhodospiraceae bacterium]